MLSIDRVGETGAEKLVITKYVTKKNYGQHWKPLCETVMSRSIFDGLFIFSVFTTLNSILSSEFPLFPNPGNLRPFWLDLNTV